MNEGGLALRGFDQGDAIASSFAESGAASVDARPRAEIADAFLAASSRTDTAGRAGHGGGALP